jgi:hypothetical protein
MTGDVNMLIINLKVNPSLLGNDLQEKRKLDPGETRGREV